MYTLYAVYLTAVPLTRPLVERHERVIFDSAGHLDFRTYYILLLYCVVYNFLFQIEIVDQNGFVDLRDNNLYVRN